MSLDETPGQLYRLAVKQTLFRYADPPGSDPDAALSSYLETRYAEERVRLASSAARATESERTALRNGVFVLAAGVFAYGHLDAAESIIDHVPSSGAIRQLALALKAMLPLPASLDPLADPEGFRRWLRDHRSGLRWDEALGKYVATAG